MMTVQTPSAGPASRGAFRNPYYHFGCREFMLDVISRSQRGRICEYGRGETRISTPFAIGTDKDCPVSISCGEEGRVLDFMGTKISLDGKILPTSSGWVRTGCRSENGIAVLRLPVPEGAVLDPDTEVVVVPNGYELRRDPRKTVENIIRLREICGFGRLLCVLGLGEPSTAALLAYMGADMLDCSLQEASGLNGIKLVPEAEIYTGNDESKHNVSQMKAEMDKIRMFIECDRLRELADQRSFSSPSSVAMLRLYDEFGYGYAEETCSVTGCRFGCNTVQALRRPDLKRYRERISGYRKPENKKILLLLPCSAKKPYHISKSHKAFASAVHTGPHDALVHEVIITSPLGIVPRELDFMYPANSYDIPVTGEWKCEEKQMIRGMLSELLKQGYEKVVCHLGEDRVLVEDICDMVITAEKDPVSPDALRNLDSALREMASGMEPADPREDRLNQFRSVLGFQFGSEAADLLTENSYVIGKFPYWKLFRDVSGKKVQLGMMTPERGMVSLTLDGARILAGIGVNTVEIMDFEMKGNLFAVGVTDADPGIRIGDEAIAVCSGEVRGVGVAAMCGREMVSLKRGIAVRIRHKTK